MKEQLVRYFPYIISILIFFFCAIYITWPLVFHLGDRATGTGDELVVDWIMNWDVHAFITNPLYIFSAPIYYPYADTLAYSDTLVTATLLAAPIFLFIHQPIALINVTLLSSLTLLGFSLFLFVFVSSRRFFAGILAGLLVVFSPAVLDNAVHLQMLAIFWVPLAMVSCVFFVKTKRFRYAIITCICSLLQIYNSFLPAYFIVLFIVVYGILLVMYQRQHVFHLLNRKILLAGIITVLLSLPVILPYYQVSHEFHYTRDIRDTIHFALQPEDFLYTNGYSRFFSLFNQIQIHAAYPKNAELKPGFLGLVFTLLAIFSSSYLLYTWRWYALEIKAIFITGIVGLVLSFGPFLHFNRVTLHHPLIPLPYLAFYYLAPGFQGFRNSSRFEMLFIICFAIVIGMVLSQLLDLKKTLPRIILGLLLVCVIGEFAFPTQLVSIPQTSQFPVEYRWLAMHPEIQPIIQLPSYNWNMPFVQEELWREYYSTIEFHRSVNGYSGFSPDEWQNLITTASVSFPDNAIYQKLKQEKIPYLIIYPKQFDVMHDSLFRYQGKQAFDGKTVLKKLSADKRYRLINRIGNAWIFKI